MNPLMKMFSEISSSIALGLILFNIEKRILYSKLKLIIPNVVLVGNILVDVVHGVFNVIYIINSPDPLDGNNPFLILINMINFIIIALVFIFAIYMIYFYKNYEEKYYAVPLIAVTISILPYIMSAIQGLFIFSLVSSNVDVSYFFYVNLQAHPKIDYLIIFYFIIRNLKKPEILDETSNDK